MARIGHYHDAEGRSAFRIFAPERQRVTVVFPDQGTTLDLAHDELGYWTGQCDRLPAGTRYMIRLNDDQVPDIASRWQPEGVHAPSVIATPRKVQSPGWKGVTLGEAIVYELHLGTFTPEGTLAAAAGRLDYLQDLGITVIELLPIAAFPGRCNWGYDGVFNFALFSGYGTYEDLASFIEAAHARGIAVLLDVVYNHFGPEGNYTTFFGPYTKRAETPWGASINFNRELNYGVREFFLENIRYWLQEIGFDGLRMDAVSMIIDDMPVHFLREANDLAYAIGAEEGREVIMIAEHLRNNRYVTNDRGFDFGAQWSDDFSHAVFALITGERQRHYANHGPFADVVKAFEVGFVLDGTRLDRYRGWLTGTDGRDVHPNEHIAYIQNHDQIGNRPFGDRMVVTYGRSRALLGLTALLASPYVPMLFMGDEYGEQAPFLFFVDFSDPAVIQGVRTGRRADYEFGDTEPPDPQSPETFLASKLRWASLDSEPGASIHAYCRTLIHWKRSGWLGPRERSQVSIGATDATRVLRVETPRSLTILNFSDVAQPMGDVEGWRLALSYAEPDAEGRLPAFGAAIYERPDQELTRP